jgi:hypothetical protein
LAYQALFLIFKIKVMAKFKEPKEYITRVYKETTGITHTWYFEKDKLNLGPYKVVVDYPKNYTSEAEDKKQSNKKLPKTKRRFTNPDTGREISYQRAKQLGLVK